MPGRNLPAFAAAVHRVAGHRLSLARQDGRRYSLRAHLPGLQEINFSQVFAGQAVGIKEVHDDIWLVSFMDYDLGHFDLEIKVLEPLENPFGPKVLPMSKVRWTQAGSYEHRKLSQSQNRPRSRGRLFSTVLNFARATELLHGSDCHVRFALLLMIPVRGLWGQITRPVEDLLAPRI